MLGWWQDFLVVSVLMGDCVQVYGVLLVGGLSRGVVCLMLYVFMPPPLRGRKKIKIKNIQNYKNFLKIRIIIIN